MTQQPQRIFRFPIQGGAGHPVLEIAAESIEEAYAAATDLVEGIRPEDLILPDDDAAALKRELYEVLASSGLDRIDALVKINRTDAGPGPAEVILYDRSASWSASIDTVREVLGDLPQRVLNADDPSEAFWDFTTSKGDNDS